MGPAGLVSKRRDRPYQSGRSKHWQKIKNRPHPAIGRVMEAWNQIRRDRAMSDDEIETMVRELINEHLTDDNVREAALNC